MVLPVQGQHVNLWSIPYLGDFPGGSDGKESAYNGGAPGLIPGLGRSLREGKCTYSSILAWRILWNEATGELQSMGSQRVRHNWAINTFTFSRGSSSSPIWLWVFYHKEGWALKNWYFQIAGGDSWESLGLQGEPTSPSKGNQSWIFTGRTDAETEAPILWPPDAKSLHIGEDPDAGKTEGRRRKGWQKMRWWDGIMTQWTWVWASSRRQWRTGKPGMLQSMGSQRVGHDLVMEQQQ